MAHVRPNERILAVTKLETSKPAGSNITWHRWSFRAIKPTQTFRAFVARKLRAFSSFLYSMLFSIQDKIITPIWKFQKVAKCVSTELKKVFSSLKCPPAFPAPLVAGQKPFTGRQACRTDGDSNGPRGRHSTAGSAQLSLVPSLLPWATTDYYLPRRISGRQTPIKPFLYSQAPDTVFGSQSQHLLRYHSLRARPQCLKGHKRYLDVSLEPFHALFCDGQSGLLRRGQAERNSPAGPWLRSVAGVYIRVSGGLKERAELLGEGSGDLLGQQTPTPWSCLTSGSHESGSGPGFPLLFSVKCQASVLSDLVSSVDRYNTSLSRDHYKPIEHLSPAVPIQRLQRSARDRSSLWEVHG
ncbi:hypothetical protein RRG08_020590 [Elysia crispata]|uniref:Uncharacterized protein n=1 Tax=Elysia crispata TaxID=231223 RepID=A0AAE1A5U8_9GAST|nr:hypothetical protein RRG08_020590 [Elysia crispata]